MLSRVHWYVVDGCESERTALHWELTSWSTVKNVCSRRRLFCHQLVSTSHLSRIYIKLTLGFALLQGRRRSAHATTRLRAERYAPNERGDDGLSSRVRRRSAHVRPYIAEAMADTRVIEDHASLHNYGLANNILKPCTLRIHTWREIALPVWSTGAGSDSG